jgi:hypothetical protein
MPKGEREKASNLAAQQMEDIKSSLGPTIERLGADYTTGSDRAARAHSVAAAYSENLAGGEANPFATNLAVTGGISDDEAQAMETSATRGVRSVYDVLGAEAQRRQAITGGYGGAGELSQMARQSGQRQAEAVTGAKAATAGLRQTGRISGAGMVGQQQIAGAQLLTQQYGLSAQQAQAVMDQILQAKIAGLQLTQGDIAIIAELSKQPGGLGGALGNLGGMMGGAGSLLKGLAGLGFGSGDEEEQDKLPNLVGKQPLRVN